MELSELNVYSQPRRLVWERVAAAPPRAPTEREETIAAALGAFAILSSPQIRRRFMPGAGPRTVRSQLHALAAQGWARRAHLVCAGRGQTPRLYAARERPLDAGAAVRALHANAWFFALERRLPGVRARASEDGDLAFDLRGARMLLEVVAWRRSIREAIFRHDRAAAAVVYVLPDERRAIALAQYADRVLEATRGRCWFVAERDIHLGRLRAVRLGAVAGAGLRLGTLDHDAPSQAPAAAGQRCAVG
jgi:hypothetical protein